jgi:hypothetical protein
MNCHQKEQRKKRKKKKGKEKEPYDNIDLMILLFAGAIGHHTESFALPESQFSELISDKGFQKSCRGNAQTSSLSLSRKKGRTFGPTVQRDVDSAVFDSFRNLLSALPWWLATKGRPTRNFANEHSRRVFVHLDHGCLGE